MRKILSLLAVLMLVCTLAFAQTRTVTGTVRDANGNPVPFATVAEVGTKNAVQADANGNFSISVRGNGGLTVSATGFQTQNVTPSGNAASVSLARAEGQLQEVVVTSAFGIRRSQRVTPFSSQVIGEQALNIIPQTNINNALAGKIAGVQFRGQSPMKLNSQGSLRIRGGIDLTGDVSPVYIIDGSVTGSFDINPDDVQDVTVLKGANATALFGDIAKGGAIVITTKKAAPGKQTIEVNQGVTFDKVYVLPKYQNLYAGGGSADLIRFNWAPGMPNEWKALDGKMYPDYTDDASWGPRMVGQEYVPWYSWIPGTSETGTTASLVAQPNNIKDFYRTGITNVTNVSFSKGGQGSSIRVSYTNNSIRGMMPNSSSYRNTLNSNLSFDIGNHWTIATNLTFANNIINGEFNDAYSNQSAGSFNSWFHRDLDLKKLEQYRGLKTPIGTYASWNMGANPSSGNVNNVYKANYWYNFYTYFDLINNKQNRDAFYGNASLTYKLNSNFRVTGNIRRNSNRNVYEFITPTELEMSGVQTGFLGSYQTGTLNGQSLQSPDYWSFDGVASYNNRFVNNKLNFNLSVGASDTRYRFNSEEMATKNGLNVAYLYAISNSKDQPTLTNNRYSWENRAVFGTGDIEWNNFIDVNFAIRNDWYSVLLPTNNRLLSPSAGVSFFFTDFTKSIAPVLSYGKLFGSWGRKPTSGLSAYQTNFTYTVNQNKWGSNFLTSVPNTAIDPNIQGALITSFETGLDLKFAQNRFGLNALYYNETSEKAPFSVPVSGYSGYSTILTNVSKIKRTGIELVLDARIMNRKDFNWNLTATFSKILKNTVVETDTAGNRVQISSSPVFSGGSIVPPKVYQMKGEDWGQLVGVGILRNANGDAVLDPNTGFYAVEQNHKFGSVVPKVNGGLVNTFTYKDFTLNFSIDYQIGGKFFSLSEMWGSYSGLLAPTAATNDKGWNVRDAVALGGGVHVRGVSSADMKTPVDKYIDAYTYFHDDLVGANGAVADPFIHSLTYVKLREIGIGYNLPVGKMGISWLKGLNATIVARNPLLIYRETQNFDPSEISATYGEAGQFPGTRSIGFNLKFNF